MGYHYQQGMYVYVCVCVHTPHATYNRQIVIHTVTAIANRTTHTHTHTHNQMKRIVLCNGLIHMIALNRCILILQDHLGISIVRVHTSKDDKK